MSPLRLRSLRPQRRQLPSPRRASDQQPELATRRLGPERAEEEGRYGRWWICSAVNTATTTLDVRVERPHADDVAIGHHHVFESGYTASLDERRVTRAHRAHQRDSLVKPSDLRVAVQVGSVPDHVDPDLLCQGGDPAVLGLAASCSM